MKRTGHLVFPCLFCALLGLLLSAGSPAVCAQTPAPGLWENISDVIFANIAAAKAPVPKGKLPARMTHGLIVDPLSGKLLLNYSPWTPPLMATGLFSSQDQGVSWTRVPDSRITGRGECGFSFNISYPYTGRYFFFTIDGISGFTADNGVTWNLLGKHKRGFEFGDVDWSVPQPKTMFALEHEPWFKCLSTDGGATWSRMDETADAANKPGRNLRLGVVNANTLLLADSRTEGISLSEDLGKTWTKVANYLVLGHHPIHYGKKLYWTTSAGVIVSETGKDWDLVGSGLPNATWGPYFGKSEAEMMVVTDKGFFITLDGAKTWKNVSPFIKAPTIPGYDKNTVSLFFGWDAHNNILYAERSDGACYRMKLK